MGLCLGTLDKAGIFRGMMPYSCPRCLICFQSPAHLVEHLRVHELREAKKMKMEAFNIYERLRRDDP